ncbi:MAG: hypothetical protein JST79_17660 [Acidobacteria bacterium]|nr:hypothetical protein [Acidobacteriota bacterium]
MNFCKPIGSMFVLLGAMLGIYGALVPASPALYIFPHVNLVWGCVLFVFGLAMLALSRFN